MIQAVINEEERGAINELKRYSMDYYEQHERAMDICKRCSNKIRIGDIKRDNLEKSLSVKNLWRIEAKKLHYDYILQFGGNEGVPVGLRLFALDELADELLIMYKDNIE